MPSWDMGYKSEELYTYGYFREINPLYAKFIFTASGIAFPDLSKMTACELAFGQGVSITLHAAGSNTDWYGNDFNPTQVNFAKHLAAAGDVKVHLCDDAFKEFGERDDLPMFDFICLHGIWSWVNKENQGYIVDFIAKHLKVGGVLYMSYNVSPGFMAFEPVRHLMYQFNDRQLSNKLDSKQRIWSIGLFLQQLLKTGPITLGSNPNLLNRIQDTLTKDPHYLIGEYLNDTWDIIHFSDMVDALDRAKLNFACSASGSEHIERLTVNKVQHKFLSQFTDPVMYESCKDFIVFQQFRRDFFVKGRLQLSAEDRIKAIDELHLVQTIPSSQVDLNKKDINDELIFESAICLPLMELLGDHKVHKIGDVIQSMMELSQRAKQEPNLSSIPTKDMTHEQIMMLYAKEFTEEKLRETLCNMVFLGVACPAIPDPDAECIARCQKLNHEILCNPLFNQVNTLVSPFLQGGISLHEVNLKLLGLYLKHPEGSEEFFIDELLKSFKSLHLNIKRNNQMITNVEEKKEALKTYFNEFMQHALPMYKQLMLCKFDD